MAGKKINCDEPATKPEIGMDLCRMKWFKRSHLYPQGGYYIYGGYNKDILTENLSEREKAVLICKNCQGIMKEACISERGEQFCSCCENSISKGPHTAIRETISSLKCSCPLIECGCKWLGTLVGCENHLDTCGYVYKMCKLNCGEVLRRKEVERHEKVNCSQREVKCDNCYTKIKYCEMNGHLDYKCPEIKVLCDLCGTKITRDKMKLHLRCVCSMVQKMCTLGCGKKLTRGELGIHEKNNCVQRKIRCEYCFTCVTFCDNSRHLKECSLVTMTCDLCGLEYYRDDMTQHLKDDCPEKILDCPFLNRILPRGI